MGRWRPKKRKQRPKPELHHGVNYSRARVPSVGGRAGTEYSVESGKVRSLRHWRQLTFCALGALALFSLVAWFVWPHVSGLGDLVSAFASLGAYFIMAAAPLVLTGVVLYYYSGAGIEWPVRTASRLVMIASMMLIAVFTAVLVLGYVEGRLAEYRSLGWIVGCLVIVAGAGYLGQRDRPGNEGGAPKY